VRMTKRSSRRLRVPMVVLGVAALAAVVTVFFGPAGPIAAPAPVRRVSPDAETTHHMGPNDYRFKSTATGTDVVGPDGTRLARLTTGARTVRLTGPQRIFSDEDLSNIDVTTRDWVRILDRPWQPSARSKVSVARWLSDAQDWRRPDVLAVAFQYVAGVRPRRDAEGVRYAGDANFGEEIVGSRSAGGDFSDYLGLSWTFPDGVSRKPPRNRYGDVDCSGYLRLVWGYRMGIPLTWYPPAKRGTLPRTADWIGKHGPGVQLFRRHPSSRTISTRLQAGDNVFFDTDGDGKFNHSGIIVGWDSRGELRFVSSRRTANGPNMSDRGGVSVVTGKGRYPEALTAARRL